MAINSQRFDLFSPQLLLKNQEVRHEPTRNDIEHKPLSHTSNKTYALFEALPSETQAVGEVKNREIKAKPIDNTQNKGEKLIIGQSGVKIVKTLQDDLVASSISDVTNAYTDIGLTGVGETLLFLGVGIKFRESLEKEKVILEYQKMIAEKRLLRNTLNPADPEWEKLYKEEKELGNELRKEITSRLKILNELSNVAAKQTFSTVEEGTKYTNQIIKHAGSATEVTKGLSLTTGAAGAIGGVITTALSSKELIRNRKVAEAIKEEKKYVEKELEKAKKTNNQIMIQILVLRLRNLDYQEEENRIDTVRNALTLTSGILGISTSAKTIAVSVGITVGVVLGNTALVTGIGTGVVSSIALAIGLGYLAYKNRNAIQNKLNNTSISMQEWYSKKQIERLKSNKEIEKNLFYVYDREFNETTSIHPNDLDDIYRPILDEIDNEIEVIDQNLQQLDAIVPEDEVDKIAIENQKWRINQLLLTLVQKHQAVLRERQAIAMKRDENLKRIASIRMLSLEEIQKVDAKIINKTNQLISLNQNRNEINDKYVYGKDIAKFKGNEKGELLTIPELKQFHNSLYTAANQHNENMIFLSRYFEEQNKRLPSQSVEAKSLQKGVRSDKFWDIIIKGLTAAVADIRKLT